MESAIDLSCFIVIDGREVATSDLVAGADLFNVHDFQKDLGYFGLFELSLFYSADGILLEDWVGFVDFLERETLKSV